MRQSLAVAAALGALASTPSVTLSQTRGILWLSSSCDSTANVITLTGMDKGGLPELQAFDVYKRTLGDCDSEYVRITHEPLARTYGIDFQHKIVDSDVHSETMYCYRVVGVDAQRNEFRSLWPAYFEPDGIFDACSSCGLAAIAHGTLLDDWAWTVDPCPGSCFGLAGWVGDSNPAINFATVAASKIPHVFYGDIFCGTVEGCFLAVQEIAPVACSVEVGRATWGIVKQLYR